MTKDHVRLAITVAIAVVAITVVGNLALNLVGLGGSVSSWVVPALAGAFAGGLFGRLNQRSTNRPPR